MELRKVEGRWMMGPFITLGGKNLNYGAPLLVQDNGAHFGCCGARCFHTLGQRFMDPLTNRALTGAELQLVQAEFLRLFCGVLQQQTAYMIASSAQMHSFKTYPEYVLHLLLKVGMIEADSRPNLVHGPNNMHMLVFHVKGNEEKLSPYVEYNKSSWNWKISQGILDGKIIGEVVAKPKEPQKKLFEDEMNAFVAKARPAPKRDALGRFIG
jgi:hypothetical protein